MTINVTCEITNVIYLNENVLCINLILSSDALIIYFYTIYWSISFKCALLHACLFEIYIDGLDAITTLYGYLQQNFTWNYSKYKHTVSIIQMVNPRKRSKDFFEIWEGDSNRIRRVLLSLFFSVPPSQCWRSDQLCPTYNKSDCLSFVALRVQQYRVYQVLTSIDPMQLSTQWVCRQGNNGTGWKLLYSRLSIPSSNNMNISEGLVEREMIKMRWIYKVKYELYSFMYLWYSFPAKSVWPITGISVNIIWLT